MTPPEPHSWRNFFQKNFTACTLGLMTLISLLATVSLMHEDSISDKYITWLEGLVLIFANAWALALRAEKPAEPNPPEGENNRPVVPPKTVL